MGIEDATTDNAAVIQTVRELGKVELVRFTRGSSASGEVLAVPEGKQLQSVKGFLDEYLPKPERRKGTAVLTDLASFIAHANRFKSDDSALFGISDPKHPALLSVLNYHPTGPQDIPTPADHGDHRGQYSFPLSDEWLAWNEAADGDPLSQAAFANFLEDRIGDVAAPDTAMTAALEFAAQLGVTFATPAKLMELSRGISINVDAKFTVAQNISTGEGILQVSEDHKDQAGAPLRIPQAFLIQIPVFKFGAIYQIPVRLRYRKLGASVVWVLAPARLERVFQDAFTDACDKARADTLLPLYYGRPE